MTMEQRIWWRRMGTTIMMVHHHMSSPTSGNQAFIRFYRGNTNLPLDQLNAQNITGLMLEMSQLAQEQTSMLINADVSH